jgi:hypothetical protein
MKPLSPLVKKVYRIYFGCKTGTPPRYCMNLMMVVVVLEWSNESWSYAGGSVATGRVPHVSLVRDEEPD